MMFKKIKNDIYQLDIPYKKIDKICIVNDSSIGMKLLEKAYFEVDDMDGSSHDGDGDEKQVLLSIFPDYIRIETKKEDYNFWKGTESNLKKGSLGYLKNLVLSTFNGEGHLEVLAYENDLSKMTSDSFIWSYDYILKNYPFLLKK